MPRHQTPIANLDFWRDSLTWTLEQAAQLLIDIEPTSDRNGFDRSNRTPGGPNHVYSRLKDAKDEGQISTLPGRGSREIRHNRVRAADAVAWAIARGINVPESLRGLAAQAASAPPQKESSDGSPAPLRTRERNILLSMIATLADIAKLSLDTPSKSGEGIATRSQQLGCPVAARTAAEHLKKAQQLVGKHKG